MISYKDATFVISYAIAGNDETLAEGHRGR